MASRHRSRELAIQLTYQFTMSPKDMADPRAIDRFWKEQAQTGEGSRDYFEKLIYGMSGVLPAIDAHIQEALKNWRFDRLDKMDLAILRVSAFELIYEKIPTAVVIDEAVELSKKYGNKDFTVIGFPANNFMKQEPGTNEEISEFCTKNYGVTFLMMEKISVKGDDMHPLYQWLTQKSKNGVLDSEVGWNFQKYLIDEQGNLVKMIPSKVKPDDEQIVSWIAE